MPLQEPLPDSHRKIHGSTNVEHVFRHQTPGDSGAPYQRQHKTYGNQSKSNRANRSRLTQQNPAKKHRSTRSRIVSTHEDKHLAFRHETEYPQKWFPAAKGLASRHQLIKPFLLFFLGGGGVGGHGMVSYYCNSDNDSTR
ncbi:hypothetical protein RHGRI_001002 [Rhododendron griersonianum]|uniref:Uncharacterized protein n=1 Tax=Rhododendron griersonianum TaxID=479676 RepID=A0AAV6LJT8_9ERIC|nr:hypothetical protein RHGRI_001002 [Rhododendron griersonianum]